MLLCPTWSADAVVLDNRTYLFFTNPTSFLDAVSVCQQQSGAATGTLLPVGRLALLLHQLHLANRQRLQAGDAMQCTSYIILMV